MATIRKNVSSKTGKVTWTARAWAEGRDTEKTFKTKREAQDWAAKLEHDKRAGTFIDPRKARITFGEAFENMMMSKRLSFNSREAYRGCFTKHLTSIANRPLSAVAQDRDGIAALCADKKSQGKRMLSVIRNVCDEAVKSGKLTGHRLQGLQADYIPGRRDLIPVTPEQVEMMAAAMGPDGLAIRIMHATGMRVNEVLALRRSDFHQTDSGNFRVHIERQEQNGKITVLKHRKDYTGRNAPVPASVGCLVMARPDGELFACKYTSFNTRLRTAVRKAGLPAGFTSHQFKHNYVTDMVAGGLTFTDISPWVGTSARVLAETYAHLSPTAEDKALSILEGRSVTLRAA